MLTNSQSLQTFQKIMSQHTFWPEAPVSTNVEKEGRGY